MQLAEVAARDDEIVGIRPAWGQAHPVDRGKAALATVANIESAPTPEVTGNILTGLAVILGTAGIAAQQQDAARIVADGGAPLVVALFERQPGSVTVLVTTVTSPERERTLH
jgi:hypothetical protein